MNDTRHNVFLGMLFVIFILVLGVGGYFLTINITKDEEKENNITEKVLSDDYKIDKKADYIYFKDEKIISSEPDIIYKDVVINLDTAESINTSLKQELNIIRQSVKYISDNALDPNREVLYEDENIYSASERNYENFMYKEYISLIVKDYEFNCYDGSLLKSLKSYVFNVETGKQLLNNDLLEFYDINMSEVEDKVREHLQSNQSIENEIELIKIEETIAGLQSAGNYAFYIDKYGDLNISYIVKTTQVDYNETIKLN